MNYKLIEGISEKVNSAFLNKKDRIIKIFYCFNVLFNIFCSIMQKVLKKLTSKAL